MLDDVIIIYFVKNVTYEKMHCIKWLTLYDFRQYKDGVTNLAQTLIFIHCSI